MVQKGKTECAAIAALSVLALSSRFDGLCTNSCACGPGTTFSTRSVESF